MVVLVGDGNGNAVHLHVEPSFVRYVGERSVMIVVIELGRGVFLRVTGPVHAVYQENIWPAVVVVIDESDAGAERLGQEFLPERSIVMREANPGLLGYIAKRHRGGGLTTCLADPHCCSSCERKRG